MPELVCLSPAVGDHVPQVGTRWCLALADGTPVDPPHAGDGAITTEPGNPLRCPVCGHDLTHGVIEVSTGITERRRLVRPRAGWAVREVVPECFGETWYACAECGATLPEAVARRIQAEL